MKTIFCPDTLTNEVTVVFDWDDLEQLQELIRFFNNNHDRYDNYDAVAIDGLAHQLGLTAQNGLQRFQENYEAQRGDTEDEEDLSPMDEEDY